MTLQPGAPLKHVPKGLNIAQGTLQRTAIRIHVDNFLHDKVEPRYIELEEDGERVR